MRGNEIATEGTEVLSRSTDVSTECIEVLLSHLTVISSKHRNRTHSKKQSLVLALSHLIIYFLMHITYITWRANNIDCQWKGTTHSMTMLGKIFIEGWLKTN